MPVLSAATEVVQFDESAHVYTVARVQRPSVTQILKDAGLIDTTWYTDEARERGRAVHLATQFLDEDDLDWDTVLPQYGGYLAAWERFKRVLLHLDFELCGEHVGPDITRAETEAEGNTILAFL